MALLRLLLPPVIPVITLWCRWQQRRILQTGQPLPADLLIVARQIGVQAPEHIRLLTVKSIPFPGWRLSGWLARRFNLRTARTVGLTLGYGIFIRVDYQGNRRLIIHECVHTAQYERLGGIGPFLKVYLDECIEHGYPNGALEREARAGEWRFTTGLDH